MKWAGRLKVQGSASSVSGDTIFQPVGTGTFLDGFADFRLENRIFFTEKTYFVAHYEAGITAGDSISKPRELVTLNPLFNNIPLLLSKTPDDEERLFDLSKTISQGNRTIIFHRVDRLYLGFTPAWGSVKAGRQAVTWGHGFIFNPMDLVNPFSPTDIDREYKVGEDMLNLQANLFNDTDIQFLLLPGRGVNGGSLKWKRSSFGGKVHFPYKSKEFDLIAVKQERDLIVGLGGVGYAGDAAWRFDATWTFLDENDLNPDYLSLVANLDYSWVAGGKNYYGFLEFYFNGLGKSDYQSAIADSDIARRIEKGDLFVLGRAYMSATLQSEMHPLFNVFITSINNLHDPSGILQIWGVWDALQDLQITVGGTIYYGRKGSEFGGFKITGTGLFLEPSNNMFAWASYYF